MNCSMGIPPFLQPETMTAKREACESASGRIKASPVPASRSGPHLLPDLSPEFLHTAAVFCGSKQQRFGYVQHGSDRLFCLLRLLAIQFVSFGERINRRDAVLPKPFQKPDITLVRRSPAVQEHDHG